MVRNKTVLAALRKILGERGMSLEAWEASIGWETGSVVEVLQPPEGSTINRNFKLLAHKLDIDPLVFFEQLERMEKEKG